MPEKTKRPSSDRTRAGAIALAMHLPREHHDLIVQYGGSCYRDGYETAVDDTAELFGEAGGKILVIAFEELQRAEALVMDPDRINAATTQMQARIDALRAETTESAKGNCAPPQVTVTEDPEPFASEERTCGRCGRRKVRVSGRPPLDPRPPVCSMCLGAGTGGPAA